ncbi:MAG TPA: hypothetical protein VK624_02730 [Steroidobacteraceae bacterium]|nr:hypothetical protein [Steroidobacteraceae bacterium]
MRTTASIVSVLSLTGIFCAAHAEQPDKIETTHHTLHFAGPDPHVLEVRTVHGVIDVEGYDGADVDMTVTKSIRAKTADELQQAQRDVVLETADNAGTLRAIGRYQYGTTCGEESGQRNREWPQYEVRFDFKIRVPRNTQIVLCTINEGEVTVKGMRADFNVRSVNGPIELIDIAGSGEATTVNGGIEASFVAAPRENSLFRTINGDLVLSMPDAFAADLDMKTFSGGLYTDFDSEPRPIKAAAVPERKNGKLVYQTNPYATVRIGSGGPLLTLDTFNGDVRVLHRQGKENSR